MKLPAIVVSDLHLTAHPRDAYRWDLFPWLLKQAAEYRARTLLITGDLTDAKDYHGAELVNKTVAAIVSARQVFEEVLILPGNHDYLREGHHFFAFLSHLPGVTMATRPLDTSSRGEACLLLPHTKRPAHDWADFDFSHYRHVFMHQTVSGSKASNGQLMAGESLPEGLVRDAGKVWSGDIHVPQIIAGVEYIGSPYHVHFGDDFKPRALLLESRMRWESLHMKSPRRLSVTIGAASELKRLGLQPGDHLKVSLEMGTATAHQWKQERQRV